jgi:hypothetical protein
MATKKSPFSKTQTIQNYASAVGITSLELIKNPNTDLLFCKDSAGTTYRVSNKITKKADLNTASVSWFIPEDGGEASWMVHPTGENNNVVATLSFAPKASVKSPAPF